jgi:hypothetical protein
MTQQQVKQLMFGLIVVSIGLMLFASQLDLGWSFHMSRLWPGVFLVLALGAFVGSDPDGWRGGVWFLFLGAIFLMHTFHVLRLTDSWPLFVVAGGVSLMFPKGPGCSPSIPKPETPSDLTTGRGGV